MKVNVLVTQIIEVEIDKNKFNDKFIKSFREVFYNFNNIEDHIKHIGQLYARGIYNGYSDSFIEGYGVARDMGIKCKIVNTKIKID